MQFKEYYIARIISNHLKIIAYICDIWENKMTGEVSSPANGEHRMLSDKFNKLWRWISGLVTIRLNYVKITR